MLEGKERKWAFGLHGMPAILANISAIGVMMLLFWRLEMNQEARYDQNRADYRSDIKDFWETHRQLSKTLAGSIDANTKASNDLSTSIRFALDQMHGDHMKIIQSIGEAHARPAAAAPPPKPGRDG